MNRERSFPDAIYRPNPRSVSHVRWYYFLDRYSVYNQTWIMPIDQYKTTFQVLIGYFSSDACLLAYTMHLQLFKGVCCLYLLIWFRILWKWPGMNSPLLGTYLNLTVSTYENSLCIVGKQIMYWNWKVSFHSKKRCIFGWGRWVYQEKVEAIAKLHPMISIKGFRIFYWHANFYGYFI